MTQITDPRTQLPPPKINVLFHPLLHQGQRSELNTVLDHSKWGEWDTYIPRCDVLSSSANAAATMEGKRLLRVGDEMKFYCKMSGTPLSDLTPSKIEAITKSTDFMKIISPLDLATEKGRKG